METLSLQLVRKLFKFLVLTVPMRNGNHENHEKTNHLHTVLTVPMRNGNSLRALSCTISIESSYRTYEEWKQKGFITGESEIPLVLTVPMRNGNFLNLDFLSWTQRFLPYLWGMETSLLFKTLLFQFWFLPYLWGMETLHSHYSTYPWILCSYRTYEEWKHSEKCILTFFFNCSYRTYEEWKHWQLDNVVVGDVSSYRTYEEWKLFESGFSFMNSSKSILIFFSCLASDQLYGLSLLIFSRISMDSLNWLFSSKH